MYYLRNSTIVLAIVLLVSICPFSEATVSVVNFIPFSNSTPIYSTSSGVMRTLTTFTMYFAENGDAILTSCRSVSCRQMELVWHTWIPASLRGSSYSFVAVSASNVVTLLVTQASTCLLISCSPNSCAAVSGRVMLPLAAGDSIQQVHVNSPYSPNLLLLVSPNMAIPFNTKTMAIYERPMNWTKYTGNFPLRTVTSLTALPYTLFISLGSHRTVGAIVSLSHYLYWQFNTITFFTQTPNNMGSNGINELYWAQTTNTSGLLWTWPNKDCVETPFAPGEQWSTRIAPKRSVDGTILLASGKPTSHAGFTFWTPQVQISLDLGPAQPFSSTRGWALPYLSETTTQGIFVTAQASSGMHDILFCQWGIHSRKRTLGNHNIYPTPSNQWKRARTMEVLAEKQKFDQNCVRSTCELDSPGDCAVGECWGTGGRGERYMCCKHPPV